MATADTLGGIKSGGDITVSESGGAIVNSVNGKTVGIDVPADAKFTDTVYTLPKATTSVLGGIKPDGTTIKVDSNGVLSWFDRWETICAMISGNATTSYTGNLSKALNNYQYLLINIVTPDTSLRTAVNNVAFMSLNSLGCIIASVGNSSLAYNVNYPMFTYNNGDEVITVWVKFSNAYVVTVGSLSNQFKINGIIIRGR